MQYSTDPRVVCMHEFTLRLLDILDRRALGRPHGTGACMGARPHESQEPSQEVQASPNSKLPVPEERHRNLVSFEHAQFFNVNNNVFFERCGFGVSFSMSLPSFSVSALVYLSLILVLFPFLFYLLSVGGYW